MKLQVFDFKQISLATRTGLENVRRHSLSGLCSAAIIIINHLRYLQWAQSSTERRRVDKKTDKFPVVLLITSHTPISRIIEKIRDNKTEIY